jgi:hypothetical protein
MEKDTFDVFVRIGAELVVAGFKGHLRHWNPIIFDTSADIERPTSEYASEVLPSYVTQFRRHSSNSVPLNLGSVVDVSEMRAKRVIYDMFAVSMYTVIQAS